MRVDEVIPARRVLSRAVATNQRLSHENLGFLSASHGFMPLRPPRLALPAGFEIWDEVAAELPELCRGLRIRPTLVRLPVLDADEDRLPDYALLRASVVLSHFAHAYHYVGPGDPGPVPEPILRPWRQVTRRLGRGRPHMSYIDMSTYNWRYLDPACQDPPSVENLRLLVPVWGNDAERLFLVNTIETLARTTPLLVGIVRAQEAAVADDGGRLARELSGMIDCLRRVTDETLPKIDPNVLSRYPVEPVVWSKTVARLSVPISEGVPAPAGAATPSLQALDAFFERKGYATQVGAESVLLRAWFPPHWRDFHDAVAQVSVAQYLRRKNDPELTRLFRDALHAYAGEYGFLGRHRLKAYGYVEASFKTGRPSTSAFVGSFRDRSWQQVDHELESARRERYRHFAPHDDCRRAQVADVTSVCERGDVVRVTLVVEGGAVAFRPGDRCAVLPENSASLVDKTLQALRAHGGEPVTLDVAWRRALGYRVGYEHRDHVTLLDLLRFGQIRPVRQAVALLLLDLTGSPALARIVERQAEQEWELWDMFELLASESCEVDRWWRDLDSHSTLCRLIPPEHFRQYSISSAPDPTPDPATAEVPVADVTRLELTVGLLAYTATTETSRSAARSGTASGFLASGPEDDVTIRIVPSPHFRLPTDPDRPVVMFAGGTGIAPFMGFLRDRAQRPGTGMNWLFFSTRSPCDFYHQHELEEFVRQGRVELRLVFTNANANANADGDGDGDGLAPGDRRRIGEEILRADIAGQLWRLLRSSADGGLGGHFYICGRAGFAQSVTEALTTVIERHLRDVDTDAERRDLAHRTLNQLAIERRCVRDIFTTYPGPAEFDISYDISEVVTHNDEESGYWIVIDGAVYDATPFARAHPGGFAVLRAYAGMDATTAYRTVRHHLHPEVQSLLTLWRIGTARLGTPDKPVSAAHLAWVEYLFCIVELQNALRNDHSVQTAAVTYGETSTRPSWSPAKVLMSLDTHQRFLTDHLPWLIGGALDDVCKLTALDLGVAPEPWRRALGAVAHGATGRAAVSGCAALTRWLTAATECEPPRGERLFGEIREQAATLRQQDESLVGGLKCVVRDVVRQFELQFTHRQEKAGPGPPVIARAVRKIAGLLREYYEQVTACEPNAWRTGGKDDG